MTTDLLDALARFEVPAGRPAAVHVTADGAASIRRGCTWVFESAIERVARDAQAGAPCVVYHDREIVGVGLWDPGSAIPARLLSRKPVAIDDAFFADRVADALSLRAGLAETATTGMRLVNGPHDGLPDVVVDRYADTLVAKVYARAALPWLVALLQPLVDALPVERVVLRASRNVEDALGADTSGAIVLGRPLDGDVEFLEHGLVFLADPVRGQKTGFFLDQRENRVRVAQLGGNEVLNVFAYNGGFSLHAARAGAERVVSVDLSAPALEAAGAIFARNMGDPGVAACAHECVVGDAFRVMETLARQGQRFDVVVVDPPSFAKKADEVEGARRAYGRLARLGAALVRPGGTLVAASCSSRVPRAMFGETVEGALREARVAYAVEAVTGHAVDHPVRFREGEYLKAIYVRVG